MWVTRNGGRRWPWVRGAGGRAGRPAPTVTVVRGCRAGGRGPVPGPGQQFVRRPGGDHPSGGHPALLGPRAAVDLPVELTGGVRVGVHGEQHARVDRPPQQPARRVEPLRAAVDLHGRARFRARGEDGVRVELRLGPAAPGEQAARAVPEHVRARIAYGGDHAAGHRPRVHAQFGVHRHHHDVQPFQQPGLLVQRSVVEDVALDPREQPERGPPAIEFRDHGQLFPQTVGGQAAGHGEPRRMVGEHRPLVPEPGGGPAHRLDRAAAVRPVGVQMTVAAQQRPQRLAAPGERLPGRPFQVLQIAGCPVVERLPYDLRRLRADALQ